MPKLTATDLTMEMMAKLVVNPKIAHFYLNGNQELALKMLHADNGQIVNLTQEELRVATNGGWLSVALKDVYDADGNRLPGVQVVYE